MFRVMVATARVMKWTIGYFDTFVISADGGGDTMLRRDRG